MNSTKTFIKGKMNKDVSPKLMPVNEYRDARNIIVNDTKDGEAGSIQSIEGNKVSFNLPGTSNIEVIGSIVDEARGYLYSFLTDYEDRTSAGTSFANSNSICMIVATSLEAQDIDSGVGDYNGSIILTEGRFLNFSKNNRIIGVNIIEDKLYWTDDRNQPRRINILKAIYDSSVDTNVWYDNDIPKSTYYSKEEHISVARTYPFKPLDIALGFKSEDDLRGDFHYMKDKFLRFSYRYKYDEGDFSPMAPFSTIAFEPLNEGVMTEDDIEDSIISTVTRVMENSKNTVDLTMKPDVATSKVKEELQDKKVEQIEILMKESDSIIVYVIDRIDVSSMSDINLTHSYNYESRKPVKVLPESQSVRVYDKVPVKALAQESIGNRIVYGNFVDKHTSPKGLNFVAGYRRKGSNHSFSTLTNHSLKEGRSYQVGVVLVDKFGRHSEVIPSISTSDVETLDSGELIGKWVGDNVFVPYQDNSGDGGLSLSVRFDTEIDIPRTPVSNEETINREGEPGIYSETNPLGWYSYKIVVKQLEQEYYNVYLPAIANGRMDAGEASVHKEFYTVLRSDNINKIPRNLKKIGPEDKFFNSDTDVVFRVSPNHANGILFPAASIPVGKKLDILSISNYADSDIFLTSEDDAASTNTPIVGEDNATNPLVCKIEGVAGTNIPDFNNIDNCFSVAETSPFRSEIDIYWETSTSGRIRDLNATIASGATWAPYNINIDEMDYYESVPNENYSGGPFSISNEGIAIYDGEDNYITTKPVIESVTTDLGEDLTDRFSIQGSFQSWSINSNEPIAFPPTGPSAGNSYNVVLVSTVTKTISGILETRSKQFPIRVNFLNEDVNLTGVEESDFNLTYKTANGTTVVATALADNGSKNAFTRYNGVRYGIKETGMNIRPSQEITILETLQDGTRGDGDATFTINNGSGEIRCLMNRRGLNNEYRFTVYAWHEVESENAKKEVIVNISDSGSFNFDAFSSAFDIG